MQSHPTGEKSMSRDTALTNQITDFGSNRDSQTGRKICKGKRKTSLTAWGVKTEFSTCGKKDRGESIWSKDLNEQESAGYHSMMDE